MRGSSKSRPLLSRVKPAVNEFEKASNVTRTRAAAESKTRTRLDNRGFLSILAFGAACNFQILLDSSQIWFQAFGFPEFRQRFRELSGIIKSSSEGFMGFGMIGGISQ